MIGLPQNTRIFLCTQPTDFRKGFDGLTLWYRRLEQGTVEMPKPQENLSHVVTEPEDLRS